MFVLKIVTTVLIGILMLIVLFFVNGMIWEKDKASIIGFGFMEIVYVLSLICMWAQKYAVRPGSEGAVLKIVGCKRLAGSNPVYGVLTCKQKRETSCWLSNFSKTIYM